MVALRLYSNNPTGPYGSQIYYVFWKGKTNSRKRTSSNADCRESCNHRKGWGCQGPLEILCSNLLLRAGCPGLWPVGFLITPRMKIPQLPCCNSQSPWQFKIISYVKMELETQPGPSQLAIRPGMFSSVACIQLRFFWWPLILTVPKRCQGYTSSSAPDSHRVWPWRGMETTPS